MSKTFTFQYYDFTLTAFGSQVLLVDAEYFRIQSQTGAVDVVVEGFGSLPGLLTGQGIKDTPFKRLVIRDASGAGNVGKILVASQEFVDNRTYGVQTISGGTLDLASTTIVQLNRPQAQSGFFSDQSVIVANTPVTVFSPGANTNGALLLSADANFYDNVNSGTSVFISKASAPASVIDGSILTGSFFTIVQTNAGTQIRLPKEQYIAAGQGLYFIANHAMPSNTNSYRACRYKLL